LFFTESALHIPLLYYSGWIIWIFSIYLAFIPFFTFKKRGGVEKGKSYLHTTKIVKKGPYAVIRHPQYLGGILFSISITLWNPVWFNLIFSVIIIILTYHWTYAEDKKLIAKFGQEYERYKKEVPRLNPFLGMIKLILLKKKN
jgi:protein-S-isoprenylcysteine O-methyltransferase Ste14